MFLKHFREFKKVTKYVKGMTLNDFKVFYIRNDFTLFDCSELIKSINKLSYIDLPAFGKLNTDKIPNELLKRITDGKIKTLLVNPNNGLQLFLDENARPLILSKAKISGRFYYDQSPFADLLL